MSRTRLQYVTVAAIVAAVGISWVAWTRTPRYALREAAKAIKTHDLATFEEYVDVERVADRYTDDVVEFISERSRGDDRGPFSALTTAMMEAMGPQMARSTKEELERAIEGGNFTDEDGGGTVGAGRLYWRPASESESGYRGITRIRKDGKLAMATLELYDAELDLSFEVELKLRDLGSRWQIIEVSNLKVLLEQIETASKARLDEVNAEIRETLKASVSIVDLDVRATGAQVRTIDQEIWLAASVVNLTTETIKEVTFSPAILSESSDIGPAAIPARFRLTRPILPNARARGIWRYGVKRSSSEDSRLYDSLKGSGMAGGEALVREIVFENGRTLGLKSSLRDADSGEQRNKSGDMPIVDADKPVPVPDETEHRVTFVREIEYGYFDRSQPVFHSKKCRFWNQRMVRARADVLVNELNVKMHIGCRGLPLEKEKRVLAEPDLGFVYVGPTMHTYHRRGCSLIDSAMTRMSLTGAELLGARDHAACRDFPPDFAEDPIDVVLMDPPTAILARYLYATEHPDVRDYCRAESPDDIFEQVRCVRYNLRYMVRMELMNPSDYGVSATDLMQIVSDCQTRMGKENWFMVESCAEAGMRYWGVNLNK